MAEEKQIKQEKKEEKIVSTKGHNTTSDNKEVKNEVKSEVQTTIDNKTEAKPVKKEEKKVIPKKDEAVANINDVRASQKHCMYICAAIKGKKIDDAIKLLQQVVKLKAIIKFKGEIPHRHGQRMMSGRYPVDASKLMINALKGLRGNVIVNQMDLDKTVITTAFATQAHRPARARGIKAKRCHVYLIAKEITAKKENKEAKK
jgi:ribosomal protein L22